MKKILLIPAAIALSILPSCRFISISDELRETLKSNGSVNVNVSSDAGHITASDNDITRNDVTGEFTALKCNLPVDMAYTPGDCALTISGPDNVIPHISVTNEDGTLVIKSDGTNFRNLKHLKIKLSSPVLEKAEFNGAVDFQASEGMTGRDVELVVNGAGDIEIYGLKAAKAALTVNGAGDATVRDIDCESLVVSINGAGDATVAGKADSAELTISGAGDIDAEGLRATEFNSKVRGIGKIKKPKN